MTQRFHLGRETQARGIIWFTLVYENFANFYVERYNDLPIAFLIDRTKEIHLRDFDKYTVNGVSLEKLVAAKLGKIQAGKGKFSTARRGGG